MNEIEKKIVTTGLLGVALICGYCTAAFVYDNSITGYMKLFHKNAWEEAVKQVSRGEH